MRRLVLALAAAIGLAAVVGSVIPAAQGGRSLTVKLDGLPPGSAVNVLMNIGKVPNASATGMASDAGDALLALNLGNLGKNDTTAVDVYIGQCPDQSTRVYLVAQGQQPPPECNRRLIGGFLLNQTGTLTVHADSIATSGLGSSNVVKYSLAGAGAALATAVGISQGGDKNDTDTTTQTSTTTTTTTAATDFSKFNGTYTGTGTATTNSCGFTSPAEIRGILTVDQNGHGEWKKQHPNAGAEFNFQITMSGNSSSASFTGQTSWNGYTVHDEVTVSGNTITVVQTFDNGSCKVIYNIQLTKS
jgi:hypothetical protein